MGCLVAQEHIMDKLADLRKSTIGVLHHSCKQRSIGLLQQLLRSIDMHLDRTTASGPAPSLVGGLELIQPKEVIDHQITAAHTRLGATRPTLKPEPDNRRSNAFGVIHPRRARRS